MSTHNIFRIISASIFSAFTAMIVSGCSNTAKQPVQAGNQVTHVQTIGDAKSGKRKVIERDGKLYEVWEQHERLCSDCDR